MTDIDFRDLASRQVWDVRPFIGGARRASTSEGRVANVNPAREQVLCEFASGSSGDIDAAVRVARSRFEDGCWSRLPPSRRAESLLRLADLLVQAKHKLALLDSLEMGKPIQAALFDAEMYAPMLLKSWAGWTDKLLGSAAPISTDVMSFNCYEPRGVVGAITPWNFPLVNAVFKAGPALAAGNTMVLKPSELAPSSALLLAELAIEAGIPEGVFNVVPGLGETVGRALALHPDVDFLSFTGSTRTGRLVMELAGQSNGKPLILECGGKSPQIVFADVENLEMVAEAVAQNILRNQGQVCSAHSRLLVDGRIESELVGRIVELAGRRQPGDPLDPATDYGPLASPQQRDRVKAYIDGGLAAGARPLLLGKVQLQEGCYVWPSVFDRVDHEMAIMREEIFGPILCVQAFESEAKAIELANATDYGLNATVWTRDLGRGKRLARAIKAGGVAIRTGGAEGVSGATLLGHEPRRGSGFGAEIALGGLQSYSALKWVTVNGA